MAGGGQHSFCPHSRNGGIRRGVPACVRGGGGGEGERERGGRENVSERDREREKGGGGGREVGREGGRENVSDIVCVCVCVCVRVCVCRRWRGERREWRGGSGTNKSSKKCRWRPRRVVSCAIVRAVTCASCKEVEEEQLAAKARCFAY
jgi:hypothetical protein